MILKLRILPLLCLGLIFLSLIADAQDLTIESEMNTEYKKWINNNEVIKINSEYPLGYIPEPFITNTEIPFSEKGKLYSSPLPSTFDLRNLNGVTSVKDQSSCGSCWTFATMGAIESNWLIKGLGTYDLSEDNLNTCHIPFVSEPCEGGNSKESAAYLLRGSGPYSELDDPYSASHNFVDCPNDLNLQRLVTEAWFLPDNDMNLIKECIIEHGALMTNMYWLSESYNPTDYTYYYSGSSGSTNHAVTLVGWDDNKITAGGTGAWIIKNSWGSNWGENGYFYISYQDVEVNSSLVVFPKSVDLNEKIDVTTYANAGRTSSLGYGNNSADALVKFTPDTDIQLKNIGTYATQAGTTISIEVYDDFNGSDILSNKLGSISPSTCSFNGYYNFRFSTPIEIKEGNDYYIRINYQTVDYGFPIPIEKPIENYCTPIISSDIFWYKKDSYSTWYSANGKDRDPCVYVYSSPVKSFEYDLMVQNETLESGSTACFNAHNTITVAGEGTTVILSSGSSANFIAGQSIRFLPGFYAQTGSYVDAHITTNGTFCDQLPQSIVADNPVMEKSNPLAEEELDQDVIDPVLKVYPNPNNGRFTVSLENFSNGAKIMIYNSMGALIHQESTFNNNLSVDLPETKRGIYFVKAFDGLQQYNQRIIIK